MLAYNYVLTPGLFDVTFRKQEFQFFDSVDTFNSTKLYFCVKHLWLMTEIHWTKLEQ